MASGKSPSPGLWLTICEVVIPVFLKGLLEHLNKSTIISLVFNILTTLRMSCVIKLITELNRQVLFFLFLYSWA